MTHTILLSVIGLISLLTTYVQRCTTPPSANNVAALQSQIAALQAQSAVKVRIVVLYHANWETEET
jgi:hypothetical protein